MNYQILQAMLILAKSLNYSSTYTEELIKELQEMLDKEESYFQAKS